MSSEGRNVAASVRARLLNLARSSGEDFNNLLVRYGSERLLYRVSRSDHADRFVLKGAWLFYLWKLDRRATRDIDFLVSGPNSVSQITAIFEDLITTECDADEGIAFEQETLRVQEAGTDRDSAGVRVRVVGRLEAARIHIQADIGFGDRIITKPEHAELPTLLDLPAPRLGVYPPEAAIAEKVEAIVRLGEINTRFKDYFDVFLLASERRFVGESLRQQVVATFETRATPLPADIPAGLSNRHAEDSDRQRQWEAFLRRSSVRGAPESFAEVVSAVRSFLLPVLESAERGSGFVARWPPGGPWAREDE